MLLTSKLFIKILPESGFSNPPINLRIVVLPHPDGPSIATNSPLFTEKLTFLIISSPW